jgi:hypothetical protein
MINELRRRGADLPVTTSLHQKDLESPGLLWLWEAAHYCDFLSVQALPPYALWADGPPDPAFPVFLSLVTEWLSGKAVILGSFGLPVNPPPGSLNEADLTKLHCLRLSSEGDAERHFHQVLTLLRRNKSPGAFAWCFADLDSSLWDKPPYDERVHDRFYGVFGVNGSAKKTGKILSGFPRQRLSGAPDRTWIDMTANEYEENPSRGLKHLYKKFRDGCGA